MLPTADGRLAFATGDRVQFTATDKKRGLYNGAAGTVTAIEDTKLTIQLDGSRGERRTFDATEFQGFRHGYAGTIYKGQGRTLDQTYLYHSEHWRSAASYVALTRHRDKAELFVATNTAADLTQLARQMARVDDRRAASQFHDVAHQRRHQPSDGASEREAYPASGQSKTVTGDGGQAAARYQEARARAADARQARSNTEGREADRGREDDRSR